MKLIFLTNNLAGGGAEKVLVNLANALAEKEYDVTVRSLVNYGINIDSLSRKVKYEYVFEKNFRGLNYLYKLPHWMIYRIICHGTFDVIIPYLQGVLTKIVSCAPDKQKKVAWLHGEVFEKSKLFNNSGRHNDLKKYFGCYDRVVCVSEVVKDSFLRYSGLPNDIAEVLYNTFDVKGIGEKSREAIDLRISKEKVNMCTIGKIERVKGHMRLAKTVKKLSDEGFDINLLIIGEGSQRTILENFIRDQKMEQHIKLIGFEENPYKYLSKADMFVCSSYTEGFSSAVAESLILGVPVITTDCPGMSEMLGDNEYGIITENSDEGLYEGLKQLISGSESLNHYTQKAKERSEFFSPEQTVSAVERMLEEVVYE